ncbi:MAG: rRNA maturation RNase YbeY [Pseudomonadota bacterium]
MSVTVDLIVACEDWSRDVANITPLCEGALAAAVIESQGASGELALLLTDDMQMHTLNKLWRQIDKPTDVLAFEAGENPAGLLGDIAIGHGVCTRDAADMGRPLSEHLVHMVIHGYLHLIGYDHIADHEAHQMQSLEDAAMRRLGFREPYGVSSPQPATGSTP